MYSCAVDGDLPAIVALINRAYRGIGGAAGWSAEQAYLSGERTTEALLHADLSAAPLAVLLAWRDAPGSSISGCVWLEPTGEAVWYLGTLAIDPSRQNAGLGRTTLAGAEEWIAQRGGTRVRMTVINVREPLIEWYVRRGYERTGETLPFPYGDDRFGTPLRDDLGFVVLEKTL